MSLTAAVMLTVPELGLPVGLTQYLANLTMLAPFLGQPFMDGAYWSIVAEIIFYAWVRTADGRAGLAQLAGLDRRRLAGDRSARSCCRGERPAAPPAPDGVRRFLRLRHDAARAGARETAAGVVLVAAFVQALAGAAAGAARLPEAYAGAVSRSRSSWLASLPACWCLPCSCGCRPGPCRLAR
ncbi:MAG: hypothetical protein HPM95_08765 [Alphaproteobacteria bacterium]|nr:hypothetical protein [Alphaproteobacteria bacterium]